MRHLFLVFQLEIDDSNALEPVLSDPIFWITLFQIYLQSTPLFSTFASPMREQDILLQILTSKYEEMRLRNPHFSKRAFSKRIGLSPGATSEVLNGRRRVSFKVAERIISRLSLDPQERSELLASFIETKRGAGHIDKIDPNYLQISADQFRVIRDWFHFAILALMRTQDFRSSNTWIARRLGLTHTTVKAAISRLIRLGFIERNDGQLKRSKVRLRTTDDVASTSVRQAHFQYLENAKDALQNISVEQRDFTSLMMSINPEQLPMAKELTRKFQDELSSKLEKQLGSEVYQLCIQLFPLTKIKGAKE